MGRRLVGIFILSLKRLNWASIRISITRIVRRIRHLWVHKSRGHRLTRGLSISWVRIRIPGVHSRRMHVILGIRMML
jgi:hypothetical protein